MVTIPLSRFKELEKIEVEFNKRKEGEWWCGYQHAYMYHTYTLSERDEIIERLIYDVKSLTSQISELKSKKRRWI